jgi:hypothetical protein
MVSAIYYCCFIDSTAVEFTIEWGHGQFTAYLYRNVTSDSFKLGFSSSVCFQFINRTFWILIVDKCWNIFSEKKNALCQQIGSRLIQRNQIFSEGFFGEGSFGTLKLFPIKWMDFFCADTISLV